MSWKQGSEQTLILTAEAIKGELRPKGNPAPTHHKRWVDTINHIVNPPRTPDTDKDAGRLVWSIQKSSTPDPGCNAVAQPQDRSCSCPAAATAVVTTGSTRRTPADEVVTQQF